MTNASSFPLHGRDSHHAKRVRQGTHDQWAHPPVKTAMNAHCICSAWQFPVRQSAPCMFMAFSMGDAAAFVSFTAAWLQLHALSCETMSTRSGRNSCKFARWLADDCGVPFGCCFVVELCCPSSYFNTRNWSSLAVALRHENDVEQVGDGVIGR